MRGHAPRGRCRYGPHHVVIHRGPLPWWLRAFVAVGVLSWFVRGYREG